MEQFLYKNYLKYLKENKTPIYKSLLALPRCAAMLLIFLILSSALVLVFITMGNLRQYAFIPLGLEAIIIPVILAVFAAIIKNESDTNVIVAYGTVVIFFPIALILALFGVLELLNIIKKNEFEQMKSFSDVLQGILDTQYEGGIFEKINC